MALITTTKGSETLQLDYCYIDSDASPIQEHDDLFTFNLCHNRYQLRNDYDHLDFSECICWSDHEKVISEELGENTLFFPIFLYDHSGIVLSTHAFGCSLDSGQIGYAIVKGSDAKKYYAVDDIDDTILCKIEDKLTNLLRYEKCYLNNEVYQVDYYNNNDNSDDDLGELMMNQGFLYTFDEVKDACEYMCDNQELIDEFLLEIEKGC